MSKKLRTLSPPLRYSSMWMSMKDAYLIVSSMSLRVRVCQSKREGVHHVKRSTKRTTNP